jgi:thiol:disulfide interchange protein
VIETHQEGNEESIEGGGSKDEGSEGKGLWVLFLLGFGFGFVALLTPCVFPMIPMTVSFFTKTSKTRAQGIRNALIYGFFIIFIYTGLGLALTAIFGVDIMNVISTDPWFNLFLFALLVIFGISFLGAFEITLPASWANKADRASDRGGILGIFFMAATLAIVSFSCTGPIVGTALAGAAKGGYMGPASIMFGFSLALSLPFMLFAAFPGWLNSLPKSGGWLNSVKVVLGLLEIGFAFKFLSNADLVWQLGLLKRELFIAIWVAVALSTALYLFGKLRFPHDSPFEKLSVTRFMFGLLFFVLGVYMVPGMWGAPLKIISGFPPPMFYAENPNGLGGGGGSSAAHGGGGQVHPHFTDYDEGMAAAKLEGKPMLIDFTGWACVNCRKMEETVWPDPKVADILENKVVLVSLYVDERIKLPEEEQREEELNGKTFKIKTVGNKWTYLQASRFNINAQPYYVMLDHNGNKLGGSAAFPITPKEFVAFLEEGLKLFARSK